MTIRPPGGQLSPRERDALRLTADGMTPSEAAAEMQVGVGRVNDCLRNATGKLLAHERTGLVHRAYEQSELAPPAPAPAPDGWDIVLTADQHYLLQARADDQSYKAIAKIRGVRIYDVRQAERALMSLLGAKSPAHLMKRGRELGLLGVRVREEASSSAAGSLR